MTRYRAVTTRGLAPTCLALYLLASIFAAPSAQAASIKGGAAKPAAVVASRIAAASGFSGTMLGRGHRPGNPSSDHHTGHAVDFMVSSKAEGDRVARAARSTPGVKYVLWRVKDHHDHVHVSVRR